KPNIRKVKAVVNGSNTTVSVCSRCLRSGKVERA
ncbi:MAG: 50S ribosomal protein L28, partial [Clostridia bacterium]|nr:50S ribosomal protein L28 [Clostridia bacterium]